MNTTEDRLRDAFRADAATVQAGKIRGLRDLPAQPGRPPARVRSGRKRLAAPLAAAAAVAVIAITATAVVPRILTGQPGSSPTASGSIAAGYPGSRLPAGPAPRFFVGIRPTLLPAKDPVTSLGVYSSVTGRIVATLAPPQRGRYFQAVAALGDNRTFVAAATVNDMPGSTRGCNTQLYRFQLTAQGQPTGLTPLAVRSVPGYLDFDTSLAASASGNVIAYATHSCTRAYDGSIGVIRLRTGKLRTWLFTYPSVPMNLSLSADGSLLSFASGPSSGPRVGAGAAAWVLRTRSAPGPLSLRYRQVIHSEHPAAQHFLDVQSAALSPTGAVMFAATAPPRGTAIETIGAYRTTTGGLIRVIHAFSHFQMGDCAISPDPSGRYLLVYALTLRNLAWIDLATGKVTTVPVSRADNPLGAAW